MKIKAGFEKNIVVADMHSEWFRHGAEKEIPDDSTPAEVVYEQAKLSALCEKTVLFRLLARGYITQDLYDNRIKEINKELSMLKECADKSAAR